MVGLKGHATLIRTFGLVLDCWNLFLVSLFQDLKENLSLKLSEFLKCILICRDLPASCVRICLCREEEIQLDGAWHKGSQSKAGKGFFLLWQLSC